METSKYVRSYQLLENVKPTALTLLSIIGCCVVGKESTKKKFLYRLNCNSNIANAKPRVVRKLLHSVIRSNCAFWLGLLEGDLQQKSREQDNTIGLRFWRRCSSSTNRRLWNSTTEAKAAKMTADEPAQA